MAKQKGQKEKKIEKSYERHDSLVAQQKAHLQCRRPMQEMWVRFLGQENLLKKKMATHSSILVENPMDRGAWQATVHGS